MDYTKDYLPLVKEKVTEHRYIHTLGVMNEAVTLAGIYGVDENKARIAASLHDYTKYLDKELEKKIMIDNFGTDIYNRYPQSIYHGFTSSVLIQKEFGIDDEDIINAVKNHSIGRCGMSRLEKIIYIADFTEPSRNSDVSRKAHEIALKSLDDALCFIMEWTIHYLETNNKKIPKETYDAYYYIKEHKNE